MEAMIENIISFVCFLLCALPLFVLGYYSKESNEPLTFWSGDAKRLKTVITDIKSYNKEMSKLYLLSALSFFIVGLLCFVHLIMAYICFGLVCTVGSFAAWKKYKSILMKYIK